MALQTLALPRVFKHGKLELTDPNPEMAPEQVMSFYCNNYPELVVATVQGPTIEEDKALYEFKTTVGTKG